MKKRNLKHYMIPSEVTRQLCRLIISELRRGCRKYIGPSTGPYNSFGNDAAAKPPHRFEIKDS